MRMLKTPVLSTLTLAAGLSFALPSQGQEKEKPSVSPIVSCAEKIVRGFNPPNYPYNMSSLMSEKQDRLVFYFGPSASQKSSDRSLIASVKAQISVESLAQRSLDVEVGLAGNRRMYDIEFCHAALLENFRQCIVKGTDWKWDRRALSPHCDRII